MRPEALPWLGQHLGGAKDGLDRAKGRACEERFAGLTDDLIGTDFEIEFCEFVTTRRHASGGHRVSCIIYRGGRNEAMEEAEKRRGNVDLVRNEADSEAGSFENAPKDVVVTIEFARAAVCQVGEGAGSCGNGGGDDVGGRVSMAEAEVDAGGDSGLDRFKNPGAFRGDGEEQRVVAGNGTEFVDVFRGGIEHQGRIVSAVKAWL